MDFDLTEDQREIKSVAHELLARPLADRQGARGGRRRRVRRRAVARDRRARLAGDRGRRAVRRPGARRRRAGRAARGARLRLRVHAASVDGGRGGGDPGGRLRRTARALAAGAGGGRDHGRRRARGAGGRRPRGRRRRPARRRQRPSILAAAATRSRSRRSTRRAATRLASGATPWARRGRRSTDGAAARVRTAVAAEVVGVCQRALEMTLEYVKDRKQFGVPVGSFQAVAHRCAQMLLHTESARSTAYFAAWAADADPSRLAEAAALAAAAAATAGREVGRLGDPGPRRDRLHLGGRRPLAVQARRGRPGAARWRRAPSGGAGAGGRRARGRPRRVGIGRGSPRPSNPAGGSDAPRAVESARRQAAGAQPPGCWAISADMWPTLPATAELRVAMTG